MSVMKKFISTDKDGKSTEIDIGADAKNIDTQFTETVVRENIMSGEKLNVILGKIKKLFTDFEDTNDSAAAALRGLFGGILPDPVLANNSLETIQKAAQLGIADKFWSVGDKIPITLNGAVGDLTFNNETYYAFIIGFNHNPNTEGKNTIHFQFGKTENGTDIAFVDSKQNNSGNSAAFRMNTANNNAGGWESSYMRQTICPQFFAALPEEWQKIINPCTKYSDNTGGGTNTPDCVSATSDKIWLLSEYEVFGANTNSNSGEISHQQQYEYYAAKNSKVKNKHDASTTACFWYLRSVNAPTSTAFCGVGEGGHEGGSYASYSGGFAPCFMIGGTDPSMICYSTTPQKIGTWIDGSDICRVAWEFKPSEADSAMAQTYMDLPNAPKLGTIKMIVNQTFAVGNGADVKVFCSAQDACAAAQSYKEYSANRVLCMLDYIPD